MGRNIFGVNYSFWDKDTSGQSESAGGEGKTTREMKLKGTFAGAGWDFVTVWGIGEGQTYPYLYLEKHLAGDLNGDGVVNLLDFAIFAGGWLTQK